MALTHLVLVGTALLSLAFISGSEAGEVGVCYGMLSSHLMPPPEVVQLLKKNGITKVMLYDANAGALSALANSGIKVKMALPNVNLVEAAGSTWYARQWVENNVKAFVDRGTVIDGVDVGNEVFHQASWLTPQLLPAMKNIHAALVSVGLADAVKVTTPIALDALKEPSWPPSAGEFRADLAQSVLGPMLDFLDQTGSHFVFNIYPYFAYKRNPTIDLDYVLFRPNKGNTDAGNGLIYYNMFDAMLDAVFHAEEKLRRSRGHASRSRMLLQGGGSTSGPGETGHAASASSVRRVASDDDVAGQKSTVGDDSTANAQTYNNNLISKVLRGIGTPYRPNATINVYIFSLFNEDLKTGGDDETHFGLFYPDGTPVYKVDFGGQPGPGGASWCTANAAVGDKRLQDALDWACSNGADCSAIQPGKPCYQPNTMAAHASYAFDSYYKSKGRASGTCDFAGAASIVFQKPAGICDASAGSWCVANPAVGDTRLQAALDYACGNGANCTPIKPGGRCFDPDTKVAHATYAFNDYYQRNGRSEQSCAFGGCGSVVHDQPKFGNCVYSGGGIKSSEHEARARS